MTNMGRLSATSILLLLSLLAAGSPSCAAAADNDVGSTIRLPSDTTQAAPARPWECCNFALCTKSNPPICHCEDEVEQCAPTCKSCEPSTSDPPRFVCNDQYIGDPGPICRPWDCCDSAPCTKSIPPMCRCTDEVEKCAATCKSCVPAASDPSLRVCKDIYRGYPGPRCTVDGNNCGN
uniref:Uncharacterized protein n=1 Tax=Avena sativa TaxID=4498 RepID=A0ACD5VII4_AVESA